jgi:hypothetical protein
MNNHDVKYLFSHQDQEKMITQKVAQQDNVAIHQWLAVANQDANIDEKKNFTRIFSTIDINTSLQKLITLLLCNK